MLIIGCWMSVPAVFSQDFINTRKISLSLGDTSIVAGILADVKIDEVSPGVFYYWYANGKISTNQGGYAGNLLHGEYVEYGPDGVLLLKGQYSHGARSGQWMYWYEDGTLREHISYENGLLHGKTTRYGPDGRISYSANYKQNLLHGELVTVLSDTLYQVQYRKGEERKRTVLYVFDSHK